MAWNLNQRMPVFCLFSPALGMEARIYILNPRGVMSFRDSLPSVAKKPKPVDPITGGAPAQKPIQPPAPKPAAGPRPVKPKVVERTEMLVRSCGHQEAFEHLKPDPYKDARIKKFTGKACTVCKQAQQQAEQAAQREGKPKKTKWKGNKQFGRLPHGATYFTIYHADTMHWEGSLVVPDCEKISDQAGGIFPLLNKLDKRWRQSHPEMAAKASGLTVEDPVEEAK